MRTCAWISCGRTVYPLVKGGPTPQYCRPLCRTLTDGYARYLDGGGDDTETVVIADTVITIDSRKVNDHARHLKQMAAARQEALW